MLFPAHFDELTRYNISIGLDNLWSFGISLAVTYTREEGDRDDTPGTKFDKGRQTVTLSASQEFDLWNIIHR